MIKNVTEYLHESARNHPDKIAFRDGKNNITFAELDNRARKIAHTIQRVLFGKKNQPVGVYITRSIDCLTAFFGVAYSGNFYSPLDTKMPDSRLKKILETLKPEIVITDGGKLNGEQYDLKLITLAEGYQEEALPFSQCGCRRILDIDPLYVLFTSGSTGTPKGVVISHRGVIDYTEWLKDTFSFDENTVFGNQAPFYFDNSILDIYSTIKNASTMVILPEKLFLLPGKLLEFMNEQKVNTIFWVPSALVGVANSGILERVHLDFIKKILFCGEVMPTRQFNVWKKYYPNVTFANLYGPTEITDVCTCYFVERDFRDDEPLPIGKACENMEILILNEEDQLAEPKEDGELCVRGCGVSMGYYGMPERTAAVFCQNPTNPYYHDIIYRTGDIAHFNEEGEIIYVGRKDFQIKHQGHRIELGEIESVLSGMDGILQSCAVYNAEEKKICLFCILKEKNEILRENDVYGWLKDRLPRYMLPSVITFLSEFPLNLNGKIDRIALQRWKG